MGVTLFLKPDEEFKVGVPGATEGAKLIPPDRAVTGTVHWLISHIKISGRVIST